MVCCVWHVSGCIWHVSAAYGNDIPAMLRNVKGHLAINVRMYSAPAVNFLSQISRFMYK